MFFFFFVNSLYICKNFIKITLMKRFFEMFPKDLKMALTYAIVCVVILADLYLLILLAYMFNA